MEKFCPTCQIKKSVQDFNKDRYSSDGLTSACRTCRQMRWKKYAETNPDKIEQRKEEFNVKRREDRKENPDKVRQYAREYCKKNRDKRAISDRKYREKNRGTYNASKAKRRASKLKATPSWLSEDQLLEIKLLYLFVAERRKITGLKLQIDHIVPLQGENVCGLHVPWNLQVLTASENSSKGNRFTQL